MIRLNRLGRDGLSQHYDFIVEHLYHAPVNFEEQLGARGGRYFYRAVGQRADERRVVVEHFKAPIDTRKLSRRHVAFKYSIVWGDDL